MHVPLATFLRHVVLRDQVHKDLCRQQPFACVPQGQAVLEEPHPHAAEVKALRAQAARWREAAQSTEQLQAEQKQLQGATVRLHCFHSDADVHADVPCALVGTAKQHAIATSTALPAVAGPPCM